jgi:uncharacterized oxidoreductase
MKLENLVVFITGGSSGIGLALARRLLERGNTVVVSGRNAAKLDIAKRNIPGLQVLESDASDGAQAQAAIDFIASRYGRLNVLVNNAGVMHSWDLLQENDATHLEAAAREIAINYLVPVQMTMRALPLLLQEREAAIVNISSGLAYTPIARFPVYCGTKAALHSFSKSLRHQLQSTRVRVFDVLPPRTATDLHEDVKAAKTSADAVARKTLRGMEKNRYEIPIGESSLLRFMERIAPAFIEHRLLAIGPEPEKAVP